MSVLRTEYVMKTRLATICIRRDLDNEMWNHLQFHCMYTSISTYTWDLDRSNISWTSKPNVSVHSHQKVPTQFQFNWVFARKNLTIHLLGASWNSFCWGYKKNLEISHVEPKNCGWKMMFLSVWKIFLRCQPLLFRVDFLQTVRVLSLHLWAWRNLQKSHERFTSSCSKSYHLALDLPLESEPLKIIHCKKCVFLRNSDLFFIVVP